MSRELRDWLMQNDLRPLLDRIDTSGLQQADTPTKAVVVFNHQPAPVSGIAVFHARFPIRTAAGSQPVTVRDTAGQVIPSQIVNESLRDLSGHPPKNLWEFDLRFYVEDVPAHGWRAYAATYGYAPESAGDVKIWREPDSPVLIAAETECRAGDLPAALSLLSLQPNNDRG